MSVQLVLNNIRVRRGCGLMSFVAYSTIPLCSHNFHFFHTPCSLFMGNPNAGVVSSYSLPVTSLGAGNARVVSDDVRNLRALDKCLLVDTDNQEGIPVFPFWVWPA